NNANTNLVACGDHAYHMLLHRRRDALLATGDADAIRCQICGCYDTQEEIFVRRAYDGRHRAYHRYCCNDAQRRRYAASMARAESNGTRQPRKWTEAHVIARRNEGERAR